MPAFSNNSRIQKSRILLGLISRNGFTPAKSLRKKYTQLVFLSTGKAVFEKRRLRAPTIFMGMLTLAICPRKWMDFFQIQTSGLSSFLYLLIVQLHTFMFTRYTKIQCMKEEMIVAFHLHESVFTIIYNTEYYQLGIA